VRASVAYKPGEYDARRLRSQREIIRDVMLSAADCETWLTLGELRALTRYGEASISAQLRHLRKSENGGYDVVKRHRDGASPERPGRLPPPSWRMRLEKFAPPVPKQRLAEYMSRFARGRAALAGVGFRAEAQGETFNRKEDFKSEISDLRKKQDGEGRGRNSQWGEQSTTGANCTENSESEISDLREERSDEKPLDHSRRCEQRELFAGRDGLKGRVEEDQAQDLGLDRNLEGNLRVGREEKRNGPGDTTSCLRGGNREKEFVGNEPCNSNSYINSSFHSEAKSAKELAVARELRVGQGPVCGPARVRPEVLERVRRRDAARAWTARRSRLQRSALPRVKVCSAWGSSSCGQHTAQNRNVQSGNFKFEIKPSNVAAKAATHKEHL